MQYELKLELEPALKLALHFQNIRRVLGRNEGSYYEFKFFSRRVRIKLKQYFYAIAIFFRMCRFFMLETVLKPKIQLFNFHFQI